MREEEIEKLRGVVRDCVSKHLYSSAIFFANEVAALTNDPADVYMQAQALFLGRHYRRAFHLLNASKIVLRDLRFRYLAAKCLVKFYFLIALENLNFGFGVHAFCVFGFYCVMKKGNFENFSLKFVFFILHDKRISMRNMWKLNCSSKFACRECFKKMKTRF